MKGFRTLAVGFALAVFPNALTYLAGVDWSQHVSANTAVTITGLLTIALRCITTSPIGTK